MKVLGRIEELDLLRGFFILVIIIDHIQRWPSPFTFITGEGRLWVSAAEGFFIISGLLIGYLRGRKQRDIPLKELTVKLWKRAGLLYIWTVLITLFVVAMSVVVPANPDILPRVPDTDQTSSLATYLWNVFTMGFASDLIYFLRLYAIMLFATPLVIWLLRQGKEYVVLAASLLIYGLSFLFETPEGAMQWQVLFFIPALIGFRLEHIAHWFSERPRLKRSLLVGTIITAVVTMVLSYFWVLGWSIVESPHTSFSRDAYVATRSWLDVWFTKSPLAIGRVVLAFVWFAGLFALFHAALPFIKRWLGWLLTTFGTLSLSAYCLQAIVVIFAQAYIPFSNNQIINTFTTVVIVLACWALLKMPVVQRILPR